MITYQDVMFGIFIKASSIDFQVIVMTCVSASSLKLDRL